MKTFHRKVLLRIVIVGALGALSCGEGEPPQAPVPISPNMIAKAEVENLAFAWEPLADADRYAFEISADSSFTTTIFEHDSLRLPFLNLSTALFNESGMYYWRVAAANQYGWSDWSQVATFYWRGKAESEGLNRNTK